MDIILQKYKFELKKVLFTEISNYIYNLTEDFVDNLFNINNKYISLINSLTNNVRELIKQIILKTINFFNKVVLNIMTD